MDVLKPYGQYWFVTITPYGTEVEPRVPPKETVMEDFKKLSEIVGVDSVGWRYDPIFVDEAHSVEWHITEFEKMAKALAGYTQTCVIRKVTGWQSTEHCSGCMTVHTFETALHANLNVPKQKNNQRNGSCACLLGVDIGAYDTCGHLCKYCYANTNPSLVKQNMKMHDPQSPFPIGHLHPDDNIHEAKQESWLDNQLRLDI